MKVELLIKCWYQVFAEKRNFMITINTYQKIKKTPQQNGKAPIYISFCVNRQKVEIPTGISIPPKNWDNVKKRIKSGEENASDKNLIIEKIHARVNDVLVRARLKNKKLTKDSFIRQFNRPDDYETFFDFIYFYQKRLSAKLELTTFHVHRTVIRKLKEYNPELHFDDITTEWLDDYYTYLRKKLKNNENTAYKNMSTIRKYVRAAFRLGYMDENPFENWAIKRTTSSCIYLTEDELGQLVDLYNSNQLEDKLQKTLQFFLFLSFSSLHVGDARMLYIEQFTPTALTYYRVKLRNSKPLPIVVPLSTPLQSLLKQIIGKRNKGLLFKKLPADQTMNDYLKQIAGLVEIDKPISHKVGRHTFATIYLRKTKDITSLKEILGHSELRETLIYAHVLDESKQEGIQVFNSFNI